MKNNDLETIWIDIEMQQKTRDRFYQRMVYVELLYRAYIGSSGIPARRFLAIEIPETETKEFDTFTVPKGFTLDIGVPGIKHEGYAACILQAASSDMNDVFTIVAKDVLDAKNTVGIDIGEGTVNFPVFQNGKFNPDASITFDKGYGAVLNSALERLQDQGFPFNSRKELQDFLNTTPSALNRRRYKVIQTIVDEEIISFVNEVAMQFSKVMNRIGSYVEVVYVYGGGATPVRNELYPELMTKAKAFGNGEALYPILYLDSRYSRYLNREGLFVMAEKLGKKK